MPRYRLRTLLIVLALAPPLIAWLIWPAIKAHYDEWQRREEVNRLQPFPIVTSILHYVPHREPMPESAEPQE